MAIPQIIKEWANKVRNEIKGKDVREALARSMEETGNTADVAKKTADEQLERVDRLIRDNPQPSEVVDARGNHNLLGDRLNSVDAHLAQTTKLLSFREKGVLIAHRGFKNLAPESTIPAFELAGEYDYFGIETDVRMSTDGELFCYHDEELSNYTTGTGKVENSSSSYLESLTFNKGSNISKYPNTKLCKFEEYIQIASKYNMWIVPEVNNPQALNKVVSTIEQYGYWSKTIFSSANKSILNTMRTINNTVPLLYVTFRAVNEDDLDYCQTINPCLMGVGVNGGFLQEGYIDLAHSKGVAVAAYIINDYGDYLNLIRAGADTITTDHIIRKV